MKLAVVTLFPEMFLAVTEYGVSGRAVDRRLVEVELFNPRRYTNDRHQTVDDRPYGGGPGMVLSIAPLRLAITEARNWTGPKVKVVYMSPQGRLLNQQAVNSFALADKNLILIAGRYEGIDERLLALEVDEEWSVGDYVLSGGELPAMVFMDALLRQIPGVLGHCQSAAQDSFAQGLLDCPHYTRPEEYEGRAVPEVLLSGNHEAIRLWRLRESLLRTWQRRPELLENASLSAEQSKIFSEIRLVDGKKDN